MTWFGFVSLVFVFYVLLMAAEFVRQLIMYQKVKQHKLEMEEMLEELSQSLKDS